jgi:hypothetical protein
MSLIFKPENHEYTSIEPDGIKWLSVTTLVSALKEPFDADAKAAKSAKNKKSKWYGLSPEEIKQAWKNESKRATDLGTWYHNQRENDLCGLDTIEKQGIALPIIKPLEKDGVKYAPEQRLSPGIYPEHFIYMKSAGLCGQADRVEVIGDVVDIYDYKTNKELKTTGFTNWEGVTSKMQHPLNHLDDCHLSHYNLQLSIYMYMILRHNPKLKAGKLVIHHIVFEEAGRDKYDNPITALDTNGDPIVKEVVNYELPYLKSEVLTLIDYLKNNRDKINKK